MKKVDIDFKSWLIGALSALCFMLFMGATSKPATVTFPDNITIYQGGGRWDVKHSGYIGN